MSEGRGQRGTRRRYERAGVEREMDREREVSARYPKEKTKEVIEIESLNARERETVRK